MTEAEETERRSLLATQRKLLELEEPVEKLEDEARGRKRTAVERRR